MILAKTEAGNQVLKDRSVRLTPRQRSAFILFDGQRSVQAVLDCGMGAAREDIDRLIELGLLARHRKADQADAGQAREPVPPVADATGSKAAHEVGTAPDPSAAGQQPQQRDPREGAKEIQAATPAAPRTSQQRYQDAYPIATRLTAGLGLRGLRLNLLVEGTTSYEALVALAPKIRAAVGQEKAGELDRALVG